MKKVNHFLGKLIFSNCFLRRMKEWSAKKANEKEDRKERKRQRLQNVLDRPSRMKAEDNTYISEVRRDSHVNVAYKTYHLLSRGCVILQLN